MRDVKSNHKVEDQAVMEDDRRKKSGPIKLTRRGKSGDSAANTQPPKRRGRPKKFLPTVTPQVQENAVFKDINGKSFKILFMLMLLQIT